MCIIGRIIIFKLSNNFSLLSQAKGRLVKTGSFTHKNPFCYRTDTPLINRAGPAWFVRVDEQLKEQLLKNNDQTYWVPDHVKVSGRRIKYSI